MTSGSEAKAEVVEMMTTMSEVVHVEGLRLWILSSTEKSPAKEGVRVIDVIMNKMKPWSTAIKVVTAKTRTMTMINEAVLA